MPDAVSGTRAEELRLTDVGEVKESRDQHEVNRYLDTGWVLISTHVRDYGEPGVVDQYTVYVLGWPRTAGEPQHPRTARW